MIRHKWGTRWLDDREVGWCHVRFALYTWRRQEAQVFWFSLKTGGDSLLVVWPQNHCDSFLVCASKPRSMVWWFWPQNHRDSFLIWTSKPREGMSVCASKQMSGWTRCDGTRLHPAACFVAKQVGARFPIFASKLTKEQWQVVHVASSQRSRESEVKDSRFDGVEYDTVEFRPNYPSLDAIFLLAHKGILVFCFHDK
jgi:hypothetical protein